MKKLIKSKLFLQVIVASLVATLATVGIVAASTTIGTNINTSGTLDASGKTTLVNASTTLMTVSGQSWFNGNPTVAAGKGLILDPSASAPTGSTGMIYFDSSASVVKVYDGATWYTVGTSTDGVTLSGSRLQLDSLNYYAALGTTTQQGLSELTVEATSTAAIPLTLVARSSQTANLFQIRNSSSANLLYVNSAGGLFASSTLQVTDTATLYGNLAVDTSTLFVNASANRVGVGTTTPFASLSINNIAGDNAFVIGSSTATWLKVDDSGLLTVAKGATFSSTLAAGATTLSGALDMGANGITTTGNIALATASSTGTVKVKALAIASTTPFTNADLSIGKAGATTTIATGRFCQYVEDQEGKKYWITLNMAAIDASAGIFATSTIPCNQ